MLAVQIESPDVAGRHFWTLLEWCRERGADEFTFSLSSRTTEAFARLQQCIRDRLDEFAGILAHHYAAAEQ